METKRSINNQEGQFQPEKTDGKLPLVHQIEQKLETNDKLIMVGRFDSLEAYDDEFQEKIVFVTAPLKSTLHFPDYQKFVSDLIRDMIDISPDGFSLPTANNPLMYRTIGRLVYAETIGKTINKTSQKVQLIDSEEIKEELFLENGYTRAAENAWEWSEESESDAKRRINIDVWPALKLAQDNIIPLLNEDGTTRSDYTGDTFINEINLEELVKEEARKNPKPNLLRRIFPK